VVITTSGFSHLKGNDKSRRAISPPVETLMKLDSLRRRLLGMSPSRTYLFFDGTDPNSDREFVAMIVRLADALRRATGEPLARRHSLRGGAESRFLVSDLDQRVKAQVTGDQVAMVPSPATGRAWQAVVYAAGQAGHHSLTAVSTYLTIWPLLTREWRWQRLASLWPGERFARWAGLKPEHLRVMKHRASGAGRDAQDSWRRLSENVDVDSLATLRMELDEPVQRIATRDAAEEETAEIPKDERLARQIWCGALMRVGFTKQTAMDVSLSQPPLLSAADMACMVDLEKSVGLRDTQTLMRTRGYALSELAARLADVTKLSQANKSFDDIERVEPSSESEVIDALQVLSAFVPADWGVALLPERPGLSESALVRLRHLRDDLFVKAVSRSPTSRYRFVVTAPELSRTSPRTQGASTRVVRVVLSTAIAIMAARA